jgi:hypothetical protein
LCGIGALLTLKSLVLYVRRRANIGYSNEMWDFNIGELKVWCSGPKSLRQHIYDNKSEERIKVAAEGLYAAGLRRETQNASLSLIFS